jgi:hypothetical protein
MLLNISHTESAVKRFCDFFIDTKKSAGISLYQLFVVQNSGEERAGRKCSESTA